MPRALFDAGPTIELTRVPCPLGSVVSAVSSTILRPGRTFPAKSAMGASPESRTAIVTSELPVVVDHALWAPVRRRDD
jgi:hypothetical protein